MVPSMRSLRLGKGMLLRVFARGCQADDTRLVPCSVLYSSRLDEEEPMDTQRN